MKKKTKTLIALAVAVLAAVAVIAINVGRKSQREDLANAVADIYILDAILQQKGSVNSKNRTMVEESYHTLLSHYGLTKVQFDTIMSWYSRHPAQYAELFHRVIGILTKREAAFNKLYERQDSIDRRVEFLEDSLRTDLWKYPRTVRLPLEDKDTIPADLVVTAALDSLRGGKVYLSMNYTFPSRNKARDTCDIRLIVSYNDTVADTLRQRIFKKLAQQTASLVCPLRDTLPAVQAQAILLTSHELSETVATLSDLKFYYMPYEVADSFRIDETIFPPLFPF